MKYITVNEEGEIIGVYTPSRRNIEISGAIAVEDANIETDFYDEGKVKRKPENPDPANCIFKNKKWEVCPNKLMKNTRYARNEELLKTDLYESFSAPLMFEKKELANWKKYRQDLRDLPETNKTAKTKEEIIWPSKPEKPKELKNKS